jgi:hypothetical protein
MLFYVIATSMISKGEKRKFHPRTGLEDSEGEQRYSSILSLTLVLDGVGGERHALAALPSGKESRYLSYRALITP